MEPSWKDVPDAPGLWVSTEGEQSVTEWIVIRVTDSMLQRPQMMDDYRDGSRYCGPIQSDPKDTQ